MGEFQIFRSAKASERVTRIYGPTNELMYLVEGEERAALIDTGCGAGDLKAYVDQLTSKPYFVILTHGHVDHAMGAADFDEVYISPLDREVYASHSAMSIRKQYMQMVMGDKFAYIEERDYVAPCSFDRFKPLAPGDVFDLGGIRLEMCIGAGHTPGMLTVLFIEERTLLLGDACNTFTFLFDEHTLGVTSYKRMLEELDGQTRGRYDRVYLSHGDEAYPTDMMASVIAVCDDIIAGRADDVPFTFFDYEAHIAKATNGEWRRVDGGLGNIAYNKEKIWL